MSEASPRQTALVVAMSAAFRKLTNGSPQIADKAQVGNDDLADEVLAQLDAAGWVLHPLVDEGAVLSLRRDLRTTVAMLRKVAHGTDAEASVDTPLGQVYERLCP